MLEADKRVTQNSKRMARMVIFSDFASNSGLNPLVAARQLPRSPDSRVTVGLGTENAGKDSRDIAVRDIVVPPDRFREESARGRGTILARGFASQTLEVELFVEGQASRWPRPR